MIFHAFWPLRDFLIRFHAFWHLSPTQLFGNCQGLGMVERRWLMACMRGWFWEKGGSGWRRICWEGARGICVWVYLLFRLRYFLIRVLLRSFPALHVNLIGLFVMPTVFLSSKVSTSSICGYAWQKSTTYNKPSPLSANLCACPAGTYCPSGTLAASTPLTCTVGSYCKKDSTAPVPCPSGQFVQARRVGSGWDPGKALGRGSGMYLRPGGRGCRMVLPVTDHEIVCRFTPRQSR